MDAYSALIAHRIETARIIALAGISIGFLPGAVWLFSLYAEAFG